MQMKGLKTHDKVCGYITFDQVFYQESDLMVSANSRWVMRCGRERYIEHCKSRREVIFSCHV